MRVLVLGANGMLGHKLVQVLGERMEVWAGVRGMQAAGVTSAILDPARTIADVRAEDQQSVQAAIERSGAEAVINAIGIVKQSSKADQSVPMIRVNSLFPHELATLCRECGARLIHISTDCVFSGKQGMYTEEDLPDAMDLYGRSKLLGEVSGPGALTLRTSIVGRELTGELGLFEWFLSQRGGSVRGFSHAVFSGFTTIALSQLIGEILDEHPELHGLWHASVAPIDKLSLLRMLRDALEVPIEIEPDASLVIDRSLDSTPLRAQIGWQPPSWEAMFAGLAADPTPYEQLRGVDAGR